MKLKNNKRYSSFLWEQEKIRRAQQPKKVFDEIQKDLKYFTKEVLPLMTVAELVVNLIRKTCDSDGALLKGIICDNAEYEVEIRKIKD